MNSCVTSASFTKQTTAAPREVDCLSPPHSSTYTYSYASTHLTQAHTHVPHSYDRTDINTLYMHIFVCQAPTDSRQNLERNNFKKFHPNVTKSMENPAQQTIYYSTNPQSILEHLSKTQTAWTVDKSQNSTYAIGSNAFPAAHYSC